MDFGFSVFNVVYWEAVIGMALKFLTLHSWGQGFRWSGADEIAVSDDTTGALAKNQT